MINLDKHTITKDDLLEPGLTRQNTVLIFNAIHWQSEEVIE